MERGLKPPLQAIVGLSRDGLGTVFRLGTRYPDILIVPWLFDAPMLVVYLMARVGSLCIPFLLGLVDKRAVQQLSDFSKREIQVAFQAAAARTNLGYLMICGALALLVFGSVPRIAAAIGVTDPTLPDVLFWLVLGQSAPVLFGATGLLMRVVERGAFYDVLLGVTAGLFVLGIAILDLREALFVAQAFAAAQLTLAAICALLLTQCGIWPGLTALFHKEIKLF
ncbi:hypothetical protein [uncultured Sulfitobacter sp.]|uniref:hypothetical protein n=1 Tax=uncultured Sulfitobacter sp. TaxID=191468 RepID=UPI002634EFE3|nr:hypothetical protein [uncultured Sulfitobacter sp.]